MWPASPIGGAGPFIVRHAHCPGGELTILAASGHVHRGGERRWSGRDRWTWEEAQRMDYETLNVHHEGAVVFAEIAAPPMNLLGPELVRDLVSLIQQAEADDSVQ